MFGTLFFFCFVFFFFNDTATTEIYPLSLHDALPLVGRPAVRVEMAGPDIARVVRPGAPGDLERPVGRKGDPRTVADGVVIHTGVDPDLRPHRLGLAQKRRGAQGRRDQKDEEKRLPELAHDGPPACYFSIILRCSIVPPQDHRARVQVPPPGPPRCIDSFSSRDLCSPSRLIHYDQVVRRLAHAKGSLISTTGSPRFNSSNACGKLVDSTFRSLSLEVFPQVIHTT